MIAFPAWYLLLAPGIATIVLFWKDRERPSGCKKCGYSREGLAPDAVCPECGTPA